MLLRVDKVVWGEYDRDDGHLRSHGDGERALLEGE